MKQQNPITTTAASIIWIVYGTAVGGVCLVATALVMPAYIVMEEVSLAGALFAVLLFALLTAFGAAFLYVGVQTIRRRARDTIGNSLGSILLGLFSLKCASGPADLGPDPHLLHVFIGAMLVLAGILALVGRSRYKACRNVRMPQAADSGYPVLSF